MDDKERNRKELCMSVKERKKNMEREREGGARENVTKINTRENERQKDENNKQTDIRRKKNKIRHRERDRHGKKAKKIKRKERTDIGYIQTNNTQRKLIVSSLLSK